MDFFFQNNSVENSLICPKDKSANHCPIEIFPIYQKKHWTIRRWDDHIVVQTSRRNMFKIDGFVAICWHTQVSWVPFWKDLDNNRDIRKPGKLSRHAVVWSAKSSVFLLFDEDNNSLMPVYQSVSQSLSHAVRYIIDSFQDFLIAYRIQT